MPVHSLKELNMSKWRRMLSLAIPLLLFAALPAADDQPTPDEKEIRSSLTVGC